MMMASCTESTTYEIHGTFTSSASAEGQTVYLKQRVIREVITLDSALVDANNEFKFNGEAKLPAIVAYCEYNNRTSNAIIIEPGTISVSLGEKNNTTQGTAQNDALTAFNDEMGLIHGEIEAILKEETSKGHSRAEAMNAIQPKLDEMKEMNIGFIEKNINTTMSNYVFTTSYYQMTVEQKERIVAQLDEESRGYDRIPMIIEALEIEKKTSKGELFTDIALPNVDGEIEKLSDLVGKTDYILIDFWASWCSPCVRSFPELTALYKKYTGTNKFEVLGVSLDSNHADWAAAIEKYGLVWEHISDVKGWECEGAKLYAVNSIPTTILIDREGKIVGRNLSFSELESYLSK